MFKDDFKYYKSRKPPPVFNDVLHFQNEGLMNKFTEYPLLNTKDNVHDFGLLPIRLWQAWELNDNPGFIFIKNPFTSCGQRYWTVRSLRDYTRKPNKLNLDAQGIIPVNYDWWYASMNNKKMLEKLRWATLGYHHNWNTKIYNEEDKSEFPLDLAAMTKAVASALGYLGFKAEAAIVNFYHLDSTLSGHTDHSEQYLEAPLFSYSFGQSAIFLLGGKTLEEKPTAMFINSGDIVVMSKNSRLCYHGVPRIIKSPNFPWNVACLHELCKLTSEFTSEFWKPFNDYLCKSRININVRQVIKSG